MTEIAHRTAFITGGANGIGLAIARSLARLGAKVALCDLDAEAIQQNRLYVHTDKTSRDPVIARSKALLEALPPAA